MIGYLLQAWQGDPSAPRAEVLDTRGPGQLSVAPAIFARALLKVAGAGLRRRDRPLLHIHVAGRGSTLRKAMIAPLAAALGLRTVVHLHDYDYGGFLDTLPRAALGPVRFLFRRARAVVVLGARDRDTVVERLGVDPARVRVVPNAVPDPGPPPPREPGGAVRLLFLGDPSRRKGVHDPPWWVPWRSCRTSRTVGWRRAATVCPRSPESGERKRDRAPLQSPVERGSGEAGRPPGENGRAHPLRPPRGRRIRRPCPTAPPCSPPWTASATPGAAWASPKRDWCRGWWSRPTGPAS